MNIGTILEIVACGRRFEEGWVGILRRLGLSLFLFVAIVPVLLLLTGTVEALWQDQYDLVLLSGRRLALLKTSCLLATSVSITGAITILQVRFWFTSFKILLPLLPTGCASTMCLALALISPSLNTLR